jgi:hypothetical protein
MVLSKIFVRGLLALALVVGVTAVTPARAVTYVGKWDPAFGSDFPDLGWRGEVSFFVPNACLALTGFVSNANACSGFDMKFLSAEVDFYKVSDPTNPAFQETLVFDPVASLLAGVDLDGGFPTGLWGAFLTPEASTLELAGAPYTQFSLFFEGDLARMFYVSDPPGGPKTFGFSDRIADDGRPFITFSVVPEPGSQLLMLMALLAIALVAQRRTARPSR